MVTRVKSKILWLEEGREETEGEGQIRKFLLLKGYHIFRLTGYFGCQQFGVRRAWIQACSRIKLASSCLKTDYLPEWVLLGRWPNSPSYAPLTSSFFSDFFDYPFPSPRRFFLFETCLELQYFFCLYLLLYYVQTLIIITC